MKKTLVCLITAAILLAATVIPAFAGYTLPFGTVLDENLNLPVNDKGFSHGATQNVVRGQFTPSRNADTAIIFNPNTVYVIDEKNDSLAAMKMTGPQWFTGDSDFNNARQYHSLSLRPEVITGFAGFLAAYCNDDLIPVAGDQQSLNDPLFTPVPAVNTDSSADYVANTGLGFTFLKDSKSKVRFFVRCLSAASGATTYKNDVIYYDCDTGVDLTAAYHDYDLYKTEDGSEFHFYIDEKFYCSVVLDNKNNVTENVETGDLKGIYFQKAEIKDATGAVVKSTEHALVNEKAKIAVVVSDKDTVCYWGAAYLFDFTDFPEEEEVVTDPVTDPVATTESTIHVDDPQTDAPVNTDAPKTDAPATEAPKDEKKGCGSALASLAIVSVISLGALCIRKKH